MPLTPPQPASHPSGPAGYTAPSAQGTPTWGGAANGTATLAACSNQVLPDETFVATGDGLNNCTLVVWTGDTTHTVTPTATDANKVVATLPTLPAWRGVSWVWPRDSDTLYGLPVRINAPENLRCDTHEVFDGQTGRRVRLFGKHLSVPGFTPRVVIEPSGGGTDTELVVTTTGTYQLTATLPNDLATGTYDVWVHNGTGGAYGWGQKLSLVVASAPASLGADILVSGGTEAAINTALALVPVAGARVILEAGTYTCEDRLVIPADRPVQLVGQGRETWDPDTQTWSNTGGTVLRFTLKSTPNTGMRFNGDRWGLSNLSAQLVSYSEIEDAALVAVGGKHGRMTGCCLVSTYNNSANDCLVSGHATVFTGQAPTYIDYDCHVDGNIFYANYRAVLVPKHSAYWRFDGNRFVTGYDGALGATAGNTVQDVGGRLHVWSDNTFLAQDKAGALIMNRALLFNDSRCRTHTVVRNDIYGGGCVDGMEGQMDYNQSEQILLHKQETDQQVFTVASATATTFTTEEAPDETDGLSGDALGEFIAYISKGQGVGQWRTCTALSVKTFTVDAAWSVNPDDTSTVVVMRSIRGFVIAHNRIDPSDRGAHADDPDYQYVGVGLFHACFDHYLESNTISRVSIGVYIRLADPTSQSDIGPCCWNDLRGNSTTDLYDWVGGGGNGPFGGEPSVPVCVTTPANSQGQMDAVSMWIGVGNSNRNHRVSSAAGDWVCQLGWKRKDNPADNGWSFTQGADKGIFLTVIEGMIIQDATALLTISPPANWSVIRHNRGAAWTGGTPAANEQLDSGDVFGNLIEATSTLDQANIAGDLYVGPAVGGAFDSHPTIGARLRIDPAAGGQLEIHG